MRRTTDTGNGPTARRRATRRAQALLVISIGGLLCRSAEAQRCSNYQALDVSYLNGCTLRVDAHVSEYHDCAAALPGRLLIRVYRDGPSNPANPNERLCAQATNGCDSPANLIFRADFDGWWDDPNCNTAWFFFIEPWLDPGDSNPLEKCTNPPGVPIEAVPPGDDDGDGIDTCADNCEFDVNPLQVNVDQDKYGDVCDPTKGDINDDGQIDNEDLAIVRRCVCGAGVTEPPPDCDMVEFARARLDLDDDVDLFDLMAFQVFFMGE